MTCPNCTNLSERVKELENEALFANSIKADEVTLEFFRKYLEMPDGNVETLCRKIIEIKTELSVCREALRKAEDALKFYVNEMEDGTAIDPVSFHAICAVRKALKAPTSPTTFEKRMKAAEKMVEAVLDCEWLIGELQMFKNRPEFNRALEKIEKAKKAWTEATK